MLGGACIVWGLLGTGFNETEKCLQYKYTTEKTHNLRRKTQLSEN